jgi:hypothetical protein
LPRSTEQSSGIAQVGASVQELETMTQQDAGREYPAVAHSLRDRADSWNTGLQAFRLA